MQLNDAQQTTLNGLRDKGAFGLEWHEHLDGCLTAWFDKTNHRYLSDEAAFWLAAGRGLDALREQERRMKAQICIETIRGRILISHKYQSNEWSELSLADDILAAIMAALEDKG